MLISNGARMESNLRCRKRRQGILQHCKLKANASVGSYYLRSTTAPGYRRCWPCSAHPSSQISDWYILQRRQGRLSWAARYEIAFNLQWM